MNTPVITICIPTTRNSDVLSTCLESLAKLPDQNFSVLLITKDPIVNIQPHLPHLQVILQKRPGLVGAMNDALERIKTPLFARIDDDVTVHSTWLDAIVHTMHNAQVGGVTGPTVIPDEEQNSRDVIRVLTTLEKTNNPFLLPFKWLYLDYLYEGKLREPSRFLPSGVFTLGSNFSASTKRGKPFEVDYAEACNYTFRTEVVKKLGGFDEFYTQGLSEYHEPDISFRVREQGLKILFNPQAAVTHHIGEGKVAASRGEARYRIRNAIYFYRRHLAHGSKILNMKFYVHIGLQNAYYLSKFVTTQSLDNLGCLMGTIDGLTCPIKR